MQCTITIEGKQFERGRALFPAWQMPLLPEQEPSEGRLPLRALITHIVHEEVAAFRERQERRLTVEALTQTQIGAGAAKGKIAMGGSDAAVPEVDTQAAVDAALLAFEDGLYYVFVDDAQQQSLDDEVHLRPDSRVTFLRLALAGG